MVYNMRSAKGLQYYNIRTFQGCAVTRTKTRKASGGHTCWKTHLEDPAMQPWHQVVVTFQLHTPATSPTGKKPRTHCIEGWVRPSVGLERCIEEKHSLRLPWLISLHIKCQYYLYAPFTWACLPWQNPNILIDPTRRIKTTNCNLD